MHGSTYSDSEMKASWEAGVTSMHSLPLRTTGHDLRHSCLHFLGLHLSLLTMATLFNSSASKRAPVVHVPHIPGQFIRHGEVHEGARERRSIRSMAAESNSNWERHTGDSDKLGI
ncbi:hypothetical protein F5B22DRAFT_44070 [Xylaria bambusicola]|uniref:uncharacterized protein n=1 Tax=Xylaria bambusicola TaxID=326684 RepID=UPI0020088A9B|nr:uncharacterized protein F5B22DRAFT_44070 [Xylaria bambusicola]KAI0502830.1 hypothetical protein F5B22DRAFT_44070 [Xylaria bambusicola]